MDKRYQVFVSSTYADLRDERQRVIKTLLDLDCIPAGMELFPAADEDQFEFIKRVIDDCDYYLLIIGGRYGSLTKEGISYTEQEYDYAVSKGLKVIAMLHEDPENIPLGKSEKDPAPRERLQQFREKVSQNRLVKTWASAEDLPGLVALNVSQAIRMHPAVGWIRANRAASDDLLSEVNDLRKEKAALQSALEQSVKHLAPEVSNLAGLDETISLHGINERPGWEPNRRWRSEVTWREIFSIISPYLERFPSDNAVKGVLTNALFANVKQDDDCRPVLDDQDFRTVAVQLKTLGLADIEYSEAIGGGMDLFWSLTPAGQKLMVELRTVSSKNPPLKS